jgi:prepilin-type N-terminal cleavage/methylation domain-containing protein
MFEWQARPRHRENGFTLMEVLIAVSILSVLFTLVYGTLNATFRTSEQMEAEADDYRLARLGFYHLALDLSMVHQPPAAPPPAGGSTAAPVTPPSLFLGEDRVRSEEGEEFPNDLIQFVSVSHGRTMRDAPESDAVTISYYLQDEVLFHETTLSNGRVTQDEIGEHLKGVNFRYLRPTDRQWVDRWDAKENKNLPPLAVEIELVVKKSGRETRRFKTSVEIPLGGHP